MRSFNSGARRLLSALTAAAVVAGLLIAPACAQKKGKQPSEADLKKVEEALPENPTVKPERDRKILVFCKCEGFYHGVIPLANKAFEMLGQKTGAFQADVTDDYTALTPENLNKYDAIVLNNTTRLKLDEKQREAILDFVQGGKGIIGVHAATDNFYDWPEGAAMMGGLFHGHPWGAGGTWAFKIDEPRHPLCKGFNSQGFLLKDEIYRMKDPYSRENLRVLVSLDMTKERNKKPGGSRKDNDNAVSWIRTLGNGRVFYCSLGHNKEVFQHPAVMQHYLDGIQWALGDMEADATPSAKLDVQPEPALCPED